MPGMWFELERIFAQDGITIGRPLFLVLSLGLLSEISSSVQDKKDSYFVGDAAGRADDFASTDRKFALNVGIQFYTPEVTVVYHSYGMEYPSLSDPRNISSKYLRHHIISQGSTFRLSRNVRV
jgi:hypothetical protein